jgi:hypothetical protein
MEGDVLVARDSNALPDEASVWSADAFAERTATLKAENGDATFAERKATLNEGEEDATFAERKATMDADDDEDVAVAERKATLKAEEGDATFAERKATMEGDARAERDGNAWTEAADEDGGRVAERKVAHGERPPFAKRKGTEDASGRAGGVTASGARDEARVRALVAELRRAMRGEKEPKEREGSWPTLKGSGDWCPDGEETPLDVLPEAMARFAREVSQAVGCDPGYVLGPMLAIAGGLIGRSTRLWVGPRWLASSAILQANLGSPGMGKGRALAYVAQPVFELGNGGVGRPAPNGYAGGEGRGQSAGRAAIQEGTVPGWRELLPELGPAQGLLVVSKDLSRHGLGATRSGARRDRARLMSLWDDSPGPDAGSPGMGGGGRILSFPRQISITGNVTPGMLREMQNAKRDDRFLDRWLFVCPDRWPKLRAEERGLVSVAAERGWSRIVQGLWERTQVMGTRARAGLEAEILRPEAEGKHAFDEAHNRHAQDLNRGRFDDTYRGPWARLETYAGRFWLVLTMLHHVAECGGKDEGRRKKDESGEEMVDGGWLMVDGEGECKMTDGKCQRADDKGQMGDESGQLARLCATPMASKAAAVGAWRVVDFFKRQVLRMQYVLDRRNFRYGTPRGASLVLRWIGRHPECNTLRFRDLTRHFCPSNGYDREMLTEGIVWLENRNALREIKSDPDGERERAVGGRPRGKEWEIHPVFLKEAGGGNG